MRKNSNRGRTTRRPRVAAKPTKLTDNPVSSTTGSVMMIKPISLSYEVARRIRYEVFLQSVTSDDGVISSSAANVNARVMLSIPKRKGHSNVEFQMNQAVIYDTFCRLVYHQENRNEQLAANTTIAFPSTTMYLDKHQIGSQLVSAYLTYHAEGSQYASASAPYNPYRVNFAKITRAQNLWTNVVNDKDGNANPEMQHWSFVMQLDRVVEKLNTDDSVMVPLCTLDFSVLVKLTTWPALKSNGKPETHSVAYAPTSSTDSKFMEMVKKFGAFGHVTTPTPPAGGHSGQQRR